MEDSINILLSYIVVLNIVGFVSMGMDKYKARHHLWRIPEKTLFLIALLGGSLGSLLGMYMFRHKTKHSYFVIGMPAIFILQIVIVGILLFIS
ncbi:MAG: DUF1294 domain-containing protein [Lachnospiraceae bacterium]